MLSLVRHRGLGGRGQFLGISGMASELSWEYDGQGVPLRNRYARLHSVQQQRHGIAEPVCLFTPDELVELGTAAGFRVWQICTSGFGNVRQVS